jgi:hypothetical protein
MSLLMFLFMKAFLLFSLMKKVTKKSCLNIFIPKIIGQIYLTDSLLLLVFDEPQFVSVFSIATPAVRAGHSLGGHSLRPTRKSLP